MIAETNAKRLRLEALMAYPPTARCREILALLKTIATEYSDQIRLDVYHAGESPYVTPTRGYQAQDKRKTVPSAYINGRVIICGSIRAIEALREEVEAELKRGPAEWQD